VQTRCCFQMNSGRTFFVIVFLLAGVTCLSGADPKKRKLQPVAKTASSADKVADAKVVKSNAEWRKLLTKQQFRVTRLKDTEPAYSGAYWQTKKDGLYRCVCCGQTLFDSRTKFESGTGWPSFWEPVNKEAVSFELDHSGQEVRTDVLCSRCDAHLGHVFPDGPPPTGQRFCMNSASLQRVSRDGTTKKVTETGKAASQKKQP
jgi:peptide-methionine (R)-S-oxide reductase